MSAASNETCADRAFAPGRFCLLLGAVLVLCFLPVLIGRETFYFRDFGIFGYPLAYYHKQRFWEGAIPLWNPLNSLGLPFLAQWNTLCLYPGSLIYLLLPLPWSLNLFCLAHLLLGGAGMYRLAHRWSGSERGAVVAGVAFALNGLMLSSLKWPNNIAVLGWMPWVVDAVQRGSRDGGRSLIVAAWVGAVQMLAGTPELILLTWVLAAVVTLGEPRSWREWLRGFGRLGLLVLVVSGLAAAQLLPFVDLLRLSQRSTQFGGSSWAMPPWGWANFILPLFHSFRSHQGVFAQYDQYWISSYYLALPVLALGLWVIPRLREWPARVLAGLAVVCLVLSLGDQGGLYPVCLKLFPPLGLMRFPIKLVVPVLFILPLLAALAVGQIERLPSDARSRAHRSLTMVGGMLLVLLAILLCLAWFRPRPMDDWPATLRSGGLRLLFLGIALAGFWRWSRGGIPLRPALLRVALPGLLVLDVLTHTPWQNPTAPAWIAAPGLAELEPRPAWGQSRALLTPAAEAYLDHWSPSNPTDDFLASRLGLFCNCNLLDGIPKVDGFYSLYLRESAAVVRELYRTTNTFHPALAGFLGVTHINVAGKSVEWQARPGAMPLASIGQQPEFAREEEMLSAMTRPDFAPREVVYLPADAAQSVPAGRVSEARIRASEWLAERATFDVETPAPAVLVLAQAFHPAWKAAINDQPAPLLRANLAFQAVVVPPGKSRVEVRYADVPFRVGAGLSLLTLMASLMAWWGPCRAVRGDARQG